MYITGFIIIIQSTSPLVLECIFPIDYNRPII